MTTPHLDALPEVLERLTREHGATDIGWLTRRARRECRDARVIEEVVRATVELSALLVWRPDGTIDHLMHVLDGSVLTQRVRAPLADREDLWCSVALHPLLTITKFAQIPLADGSGEVRLAPSGQDVLMGPRGWLPDVPRFGIVGLRLRGGRLTAVPVAESSFPDLPDQERVRRLLAGHYRTERWYSGCDDPESRPAEMVRALALGLLEDPALLAEPLPPLDELLYLSLERDCDMHYWRNRAAHVPSTVSFCVEGMPEALFGQLAQRARRYGMTFDQYVVAVLGHLAWRTPFAEDMEPRDDWDPGRTGATVTRLSTCE